MELKGKIELSLGEREKALNSYKLAKEIIEKYPDFWSSSSQNMLVNRVDEAISDLEKNK